MPLAAAKASVQACIPGAGFMLVDFVTSKHSNWCSGSGNYTFIFNYFPFGSYKGKKKEGKGRDMVIKCYNIWPLSSFKE